MNQRFIYVYCLLANDGFYMEPDVSLIKLALTKKELKYYIEKHKNEHNEYWIEKHRLDLFKEND